VGMLKEEKKAPLRRRVSSPRMARIAASAPTADSLACGQVLSDDLLASLACALRGGAVVAFCSGLPSRGLERAWCSRRWRRLLQPSIGPVSRLLAHWTQTFMGGAAGFFLLARSSVFPAAGALVWRES